MIALAWFGWVKTHPADTTGQIITGTVKKGDLIETVTATGSIAAQTGAEVKIGSQITGRIKHLYADVGTKVKAGDLIAELDLPDVHAQLDAANANKSAAQSKVVQQNENVSVGKTQTASAVAAARASLNSAQQLLKSAQAQESLQEVQTPADIKRAETALGQATAGLSTAQSTLTQVQAGAKLQIQNAQEVLNQAKATDTNNQIDVERQKVLVDKGYVAQKVLDQAIQVVAVSKSLVTSSEQSLELTKQKVTADLQTAADQVTQAVQGVASARANLQAANAETFTTASKVASVADAKAAVVVAQANLQLALGNLTTNAVHAQDVQQAKDAVNQTQAQVAVNQADVDKTTIKTPISGTVIQLAAQQGETLAAGLSAPTLIIVADLKRLEVDAYVDETDIGKVKIGQPVSITVEAFPDQVITGKVTKVAAGSTIQQGVVTYAVTIYFDENKLELKPDMTASVVIETGRQSGVLVVPSVGIQVGVKGSTVNILNKTNGKSELKAIPVKTGGTDGVNTEIKSGLKEGDVIVLAGGQSSTRRAGGASSPFGPAAGARGGGGGGGGGRPGG